MEQDVFRAGVVPGSPQTETEIKMLLCYILTKTGKPMSFLQMYEALSEYSLVNYFELVKAAEQLCASSHFSCTRGEAGEEIYTAAELGASAAAEFEGAIPLSVREKAVAAAEKVLGRQTRRSEITVTETQTETGGFQLILSIPDSGDELVSLSLYCPTKEQCALVRRRFLNAPQFIYKGVLALLTGDRAVLDETFPQDELFAEGEA